MQTCDVRAPIVVGGVVAAMPMDPCVAVTVMYPCARIRSNRSKPWLCFEAALSPDEMPASTAGRGRGDAAYGGGADAKRIVASSFPASIALIYVRGRDDTEQLPTSSMINTARVAGKHRRPSPHRCDLAARRRVSRCNGSGRGDFGWVSPRRWATITTKRTSNLRRCGCRSPVVAQLKSLVAAGDKTRRPRCDAEPHPSPDRAIYLARCTASVRVHERGALPAQPSGQFI